MKKEKKIRKRERERQRERKMETEKNEMKLRNIVDGRQLHNTVVFYKLCASFGINSIREIFMSPSF